MNQKYNVLKNIMTYGINLKIRFTRSKNRALDFSVLDAIVFNLFQITRYITEWRSLTLRTTGSLRRLSKRFGWRVSTQAKNKSDISSTWSFLFYVIRESNRFLGKIDREEIRFLSTTTTKEDGKNRIRFKTIFCYYVSRTLSKFVILTSGYVRLDLNWNSKQCTRNTILCVKQTCL